MGLFHDYPHQYTLQREGVEDSAELFAQRETVYGEFVISNQKDVFCLFGQNYMGSLKSNMMGTHFDLYDFGIDPNLITELPRGFLPRQKRVLSLEYSTNFFAEQPR